MAGRKICDSSRTLCKVSSTIFLAARTSCTKTGSMPTAFCPARPSITPMAVRYLAEMVMQIARHVPQGLLLHVDQLPGEHAHLLRLGLQPFRQMVQPLEGRAIGLQGVEPGSEGHQEKHADEQEDVLGNLAVDQADALAGFLLSLVIQSQQARHDRAKWFRAALPIPIE